MILAQLFLSFFKVGIFSFGGGYAILPIIEAEVVSGRQWITAEVFLDLIAIAQMTPGPIAVNTATFVGYQLAGVVGAAVATIGLIASPCVIVSLLFVLIRRFRRHPVIEGVLHSLTPALIALIVYSAVSVGTAAFNGPVPVVLSLSFFLVLVVTPVHPILVILSSALAGLLLL